MGCKTGRKKSYSINTKSISPVQAHNMLRLFLEWRISNFMKASSLFFFLRGLPPEQTFILLGTFEVYLSGRQKCLFEFSRATKKAFQNCGWLMGGHKLFTLLLLHGHQQRNLRLVTTAYAPQLRILSEGAHIAAPCPLRGQTQYNFRSFGRPQAPTPPDSCETW